MIKVAIVGASEDKWNKDIHMIEKAKNKIHDILLGYKTIDPNTVLVSGHCPKRGVDIWSELEAILLKCYDDKFIFTPEVNQWNDAKIPICDSDGVKYQRAIGYKSRNIKIAQECDVLYCIVPMRYVGLNIDPYPKDLYCRHCKVWKHPTNGACWTLKYCKEHFPKKETHLIVIE